MSSFIGLSAVVEAAALGRQTSSGSVTMTPAQSLAFYGQTAQSYSAQEQQQQIQIQQVTMTHGQDSTMGTNDEDDRKRRRVTRACDICWKKKIKCSNDSQSACSHCLQNGFTCTYFRDAKRRGPKALNPFEKVSPSRHSP